MKCPGCGKENQNNTPFCPACGARMEAEPIKPRFCRECGKQLRQGARFCTDCGAAVPEAAGDNTNPPDARQDGCATPRDTASAMQGGLRGADDMRQTGEGDMPFAANSTSDENAPMDPANQQPAPESNAGTANQPARTNAKRGKDFFSVLSYLGAAAAFIITLFALSVSRYASFCAITACGGFVIAALMHNGIIPVSKKFMHFLVLIGAIIMMLSALSTMKRYGVTTDTDAGTAISATCAEPCPGGGCADAYREAERLL